MPRLSRPHPNPFLRRHPCPQSLHDSSNGRFWQRWLAFSCFRSSPSSGGWRSCYSLQQEDRLPPNQRHAESLPNSCRRAERTFACCQATIPNPPFISLAEKPPKTVTACAPTVLTHGEL